MKISNTHNQNAGYSIIAAVLMIGFLLILTTSTLNLVLQEMQDGKGRQDYMKAYAGAEGALELALFKIQQEGYGYDEDSFQDSEILGSDNKIPKLSYEFESKVNVHNGEIDGYQTDIIPLFSISNGNIVESTDSLSLDIESGLVWNIIGENNGLSGDGDFQNNTSFDTKLSSVNLGNTIFLENTITISNFLSANPQSYLIIYNPTNNEKKYSLSGDVFTLPRATIISSAKVGKYTQNLETLVDNTKFLGILKYSIYSGN